jgi:RNA polymerase sigma-70 factor (ECF subfamily)
MDGGLMISKENEKYLLMQVAEGDENAFKTLFYEYHNRVGAYVLRWTKCVHSTEEIVQDVFLKIWLNRQALAKVEKFENYLFILSRNHTFNVLRKIACDRVKEQEWALECFNGESDDECNDYMPIIEKAISNLPPQQQKVFNLKRKQGLKYEEIGAMLNISGETARKHFASAQKNIIAYIKTNPGVVLLILNTTFIPK